MSASRPSQKEAGGARRSQESRVWILCVPWDEGLATVIGVLKFSRQTETQGTVPRVLKQWKPGLS